MIERVFTNLLAILFIICVCSCFIPEGKEETWNFSKEKTIIIKGIAISLVILHHFALNYEGGTIFKKCATIGHFPTAIFFFISGYGLMQKLKEADCTSLIIKKRIWKILSPYLCACTLYFFFKAFFLRGGIANLLLGVFTGELVQYSWYIIELIIWYVIMASVYKLNKSYILLFVAAFIMTLCFWGIQSEFVWYEICFIFPLGAYNALNTKKHKKTLFSIVFNICLIIIGFSAELIFWNELYGKRGSIVLAIFTNCAAIGFCNLVYYVSSNFSMKSRLWTNIGRNSYFLYLYHGLVITFVSTYFGVLSDNYSILMIICLLFMGTNIYVGIKNYFQKIENHDCMM